MIIRALKPSFRQLLRHPGLAVTAVLSLAVGIGLSTSIFSILSGVLLQPLPYPEPDRLVLVWTQFVNQDLLRNGFSEPELLDLEEGAESLRSFAPYTYGPRVVTGLQEPVQVLSGFVGVDLFEVLGVEAAEGRTFVAGDGRPGAEPVVVVGRGFRDRHFGRGGTAVGRELVINDVAHTVVGVLPRSFRFPAPEVEIWQPLALDRTDPRSRGAHYLGVVARLAPEVGTAEANGELEALAQGLQEAHRDSYPAGSGWNLTAVPLLDETVSPSVQRGLVLVMAAGVLVLLLACANVAHLLLVRVQRREREVTLRAALGAPAGRLVGRFVAEGVVLALAGGAVALLATLAALRLLPSVAAGQIPRLEEVGVDLGVLAFTLGASLLTGLLAAVAPAVRVRGYDLRGILNAAPAGDRRGGWTGRLRNALVVAEVALALVVLVGAGLLLRNFRQLQSIDPGFRAEGVLTAQLSLPGSRYGEDHRVVNLHRELLTRVRGLPGVEEAGLISFLPLTGYGFSGSFTVEGRPPDPAGAPEAAYRSVSPGYFRTMGIELVEGRTFRPGDHAEAPPVAVVDRSLARRAWPGESALGKRLKPGGPSSDAPWLEVVGVVEEVHDESPEREPAMHLYRPHTQAPSRFAYLVAHSPGTDPLALLPAIRRQLNQLDPALPLADVRPMGDRLRRALAEPRFSMLLLVVFAAAALLLTCIGLYGIISYTTARRSREIGIRMALGASRRDVVRLVLRRTAGLTAAGLAIGVVASLLLTPLLASQLYRLRPSDPVTYVAAGGVITAIALAASSLPALRIMGTDPSTALRER